MRKIISLSFLAFSFILNAQVSSIPSSSSMMQTRYNDVSINESSGRVTEYIPLINYKVGKINVPIGLNYVGNGVKVVQQSSWIGTNWNLNAGGVITRIVNDYPDEKASDRIFFNELESQGSNLEGHLYVKTPNDTRDFRADLFSFSFSGYSGSFYLDENNFPRLTDNNYELKIEFQGGLNNTNDNIIIITTPNGEKYYFGGEFASERTSSMVSVKKKGATLYNGAFELQQIQQPVAPLATTAFYLFKIENIYGDQILIDYFDDGIKNFVMYERQELPYPYYQGYNEGCFDLEQFAELNSSIFKVSIHNSKKIKKIYSANSNLEVKFNSSNLILPSDGSIPTPQYDDRVLNSIHLYDIHISENLKNIKLEYLYPSISSSSNAYRFFLEKIIFNNTNDINAQKCESYKFEYNEPELLPSRFSYETDLLGYYNGSANTSSIAENQNLVFDGAFQNLAVRETNFEFASKGTLKKVFFPTGGYNEYEYENPQISTITNVSNSLRIYRNKSEYIPSNKTSNLFTIGGELPEPGEPILHNPKIQTINIVVDVNLEPNGTYHHHKVYAEVKDLGTNQIQNGYIDLFNGTYSYHKVFSFNLLAGHDYSVTLKLNPLSVGSQDASLEATAVAYYEFYRTFPALGLRVKAIKSFESDNQQKDYKRFFYKRIENLNTNNDDSAVVLYEPNQNGNPEKYCCDSENVSNSFEVVKLIANPLNYYFANSDNQVEYKYVTTSFGGDYFEGGGIERNYKFDKQNKIQQFLYPPFTFEYPNIDYGGNNFDNSNMFNGLLLRERVFKKEGLNLVITNEKEYNYLQTIDNEIENFSVVGSTDGCLLPSNEFQGTPVIGHYSNFSYSNKLISVESKEYIDPLLSVNNVSTKLVEYEYGSLRGLPIKIKSNDSKGNTTITQFKYPIPTDIATFSFATNYINTFNAMNTNNLVSTPIEVVNKYKYSNGTEKTIGRTVNLFKQSGNAILPEKSMSAKANAVYQNSIEYTLYDSDFNLIEITQEGQLKKSLIYGYDNQIIIAEISNLAYTSIFAGTINNIKALSNNVVDENSMLALKTALDQLRSTYSQSNITTYVYDKYHQLRITTDARGYNMYQEYDECKRLKMTKDNDGNIVNEYKYNLNNN
jgi:hypothetical protein